MTTVVRDTRELQILLVEDNLDHTRLIRCHIQEFKGRTAHVIHATTLNEAKLQLAAHDFDLLLLDLHLPDADSNRTLQELSVMATTTAAIVLTAEDDQSVAMQAVKQGAQDYIVKTDITSELLERAARYAIQRKAGEIALRELNESLERRIAKRTATLNLLHDVASVANRGDDIEDALRVVLERIVEEPRWCGGQVYLPSNSGGTLVASGIESINHSHSFDAFRDELSGIRLPMKYSLVEQVVDTGEGHCECDLLKTSKPVIEEAARSMEIRGVVAFPIVVKEKTVAVLELFSATPIEDPDTVLDNMSHIATHLGRVVERRQASRTLRESDERFRLLVNAVEDYAIIMLDSNGIVVSWNAGARRITGYRSREILGSHFSRFYPDEDIRDGLPEQHLADATRRGRKAINAQRVRSNGERFPAEVVIAALRDDAGQLRGFAKVTHDATQRKRLEKEVADAAAVEAQRIGQDLHDVLGQELTGLTYQAETLRRQLERAGSPYVPTVAALVEGIRDALGQVRLLSKGLMPVEVDAHGLQASLEELTEHIQELHDVNCRFICRRPVLVDDNKTATQLYRIVQESLTNAVRHANPTRIRVELSASVTNLRVVVSDDGKGFDTSNPPSGSGVRIMQYRAGLIHAQLRFESTPGRGTRVTCNLNLRRQEFPRTSTSVAEVS